MTRAKTAGATFGFVILGAWSIGFLYLPVAVLLALAAGLADRRHGRSMALHPGLCVLAAAAQAALMLATIHIFYPNAIF